MSFANKHNKGSKFTFDTSSLPYMERRLAFDNYGDGAVKVTALYINTKSKFGDTPVVATEKELINLPQYMLDECKAIISDQDDVDAINAGKVGIVFEEFEDKTFHKKCIGARWVDLD